MTTTKERGFETPDKKDIECYDLIKERSNSKSKEEYILADAEWINSWINFVIGEYIFMIHYRGSRPHDNINLLMGKGTRRHNQIIVDSKRKVYAMQEDIWNLLTNIYGPAIILKKIGNLDIRGFYIDRKGIEKCLIIRNQIDLRSMKIEYLSDKFDKNGYIKEAEILNNVIKMKTFSITDRKLDNEKKLDEYLLGFKNYGSNCYINAGFQCLLCINIFTEYFLKEQFNKIVHKTKVMERSVCKHISNMYKKIYSKECEVIIPDTFMTMCPPGQQDVHEFLLKNLFPLIQEETDLDGKDKYDPKWNQEEAWNWYNKSHNTIIDRLFVGQYTGSVKCNHCNNKEINYETFLGISLAIAGTKLTDCLDKQFNEEELKEDVGYKCPKCNKVRKITKSIKISKSPDYLILHLKRLTSSSNKINKRINYPATFDISNYCSNPETKDYYSLIAVCVHYGGSYGGHYYAAGKRNEKVLFK